MKSLLEYVPDLPKTEKFLNILEPNVPHTIQLFYEKDKKEKKRKKSKSPPPILLHGTLEELKEVLNSKNSAGYSVCALINKGDLKGRKAENIQRVRAVFLDLDGTSPEAVQKTGFKPHIVVESSPGKFHIYWLVEDCSLEQFSDLQRAIAKKYGGDTMVCDLPRVMRVPGSIHWKGKPVISKLLKTREDLPLYTVEEIIEGLELDQKKPETQAKKVSCQTTNKSTKLALKPTVEAIRKALSFIPADDREIWLRAGMAIHDFDKSEAGYELWTEWSSRSTKFDKKSQQSTWKGFKANGGVTISTLFYMANSHGATESFGTEPKYSKKFPHTDLGNSEFLASRIVDDVYVVYQNGQMIAWNGTRWVYDKNLLNTHAIAAVKAIGLAAIVCKDDTMRAVLQRHAHQSQSKAKIDAMIGLAKQNPRLIISQDKLNIEPYLLGVQNGIVDLKTGELRLAGQADLITQYASVSYDPDATCPLFESFVAEIMDNDRDMIVYLQKAIGYSLTGSIIEHCMFLLIGIGRNGKSLLIKILQTLLGEYAVQLQSASLMENKFANNGPTPDLARLPGKRLVCVSEVDDSHKLNQVLIKHLTGGDKIPARALYKDQFEFEPQFKIWMTGNSKPAVTPNDDALWRRLHVIPFKRSFLGKNKDKKLYHKLISELPGILNWGIAGCLLWQKNGLIPPVASKLAINEYRGQMDAVGKWMEHCCTKKDNSKLPASIAYNSYLGWCSTNSLKPHSNTKFGKILSKLTNKSRAKRGVNYLGINLNSEGLKMADIAGEID